MIPDYLEVLPVSQYLTVMHFFDLGGGGDAASSAASAQAAGAKKASLIDLQMNQLMRNDLAPWRMAGMAAMTTYGQLLGLPMQTLAQQQLDTMGPAPTWDKEVPTGEKAAKNLNYQMYLQNKAAYDQMKTELTREAAQKPIDPTALLRSTPGYDWQMQQGVQALDRSAASKGMLHSGSQAQALTKFGQGLADQTYGDFMNRLAGVGSAGQGSAAQTGAAGMQTAQNIGQNYMAAGQAQAQGIYNAYNARQSMYSNIAGLGGLLGGLIF